MMRKGMGPRERARSMVHVDGLGGGYFSVNIAGFSIGFYESREAATEQADRLRGYLLAHIEAAVDIAAAPARPPKRRRRSKA